MTSNDESVDQKSEREADVDRLYKKMSVERHEKLQKDSKSNKDKKLNDEINLIKHELEKLKIKFKAFFTVDF